MIKINSYNRGISMMVVLGALIVVGFLAGALIKLSSGGQLSNAFFASSASARSAAQSGLTAAVAWLESSDEPTKQIILTMMNEWRTADGDNPVSSGNTVIPAGSTGFQRLNQADVTDPQAYRVSILGVDLKNMTIALRSEGMGKGRSRAVVTAVYSLKGLGIDFDFGQVPTNALHIEGGGDEFNRAMKIHGGTYIKGVGYCYDPIGGKMQFFGPVHIGAASGQPAFLLKDAEFHSTAYFEHPVDYQSHPDAVNNPVRQRLLFKKSVGVEKSLRLNNYTKTIDNPHPTPDVTEIYDVNFEVEQGSVFANGWIDVNFNPSHPSVKEYRKINLKNQGKLRLRQDSVYDHKKDAPDVQLANQAPLIFQNYTEATFTSAPMDILDSLGMRSPQPVAMNLTEIRGYARKVQDFNGGQNWRGLTGAAMNTLYSYCVSHNLAYTDADGQKWMVLTYGATTASGGPDGSPFSAVTNGTDGFTGKVIWVIENAVVEADGKMYQHAVSNVPVSTFTGEQSATTGGISLIYVGTGGQLNRIGGCENFRGFIYSSSTAKNTYYAGPSNKFFGGVYHKPGSGRFRIEGPDHTAVTTLGILEVYYDPIVMNELKFLGVFNDSDYKTTSALQYKEARISATLVSQSM